MKRTYFQILLTSLIAAASLCGSPAFSQTDVIQAAKDAGKLFRPIAPQDVAAAKAELQAAVADLDALFRRSLPEYDAGWRKFLRWDPCRKAPACGTCNPTADRSVRRVFLPPPYHPLNVCGNRQRPAVRCRSVIQ